MPYITVKIDYYYYYYKNFFLFKSYENASFSITIVILKISFLIEQRINCWEKKQEVLKRGSER